MTKQEQRQLFGLTKNPAWETLKIELDRFMLTQMREYGIRTDMEEAWKISGEAKGCMAVYDLLLSFEGKQKIDDDEGED